jgi:hypothetical protein
VVAVHDPRQRGVQLGASVALARRGDVAGKLGAEDGEGGASDGSGFGVQQGEQLRALVAIGRAGAGGGLAGRKGRSAAPW